MTTTTTDRERDAMSGTGHDWRWIGQEERAISNRDRPYTVSVWRCRSCGSTGTAVHRWPEPGHCVAAKHPNGEATR